MSNGKAVLLYESLEDDDSDDELDDDDDDELTEAPSSPPLPTADAAAAPLSAEDGAEAASGAAGWSELKFGSTSGCDDGSSVEDEADRPRVEVVGVASVAAVSLMPPPLAVRKALCSMGCAADGATNDGRCGISGVCANSGTADAPPSSAEVAAQPVAGGGALLLPRCLDEAAALVPLSPALPLLPSAATSTSNLPAMLSASSDGVLDDCCSAAARGAPRRPPMPAAPLLAEPEAARACTSAPCCCCCCCTSCSGGGGGPPMPAAPICIGGPTTTGATASGATTAGIAGSSGGGGGAEASSGAGPTGGASGPSMKLVDTTADSDEVDGHVSENDDAKPPLNDDTGRDEVSSEPAAEMMKWLLCSVPADDDDAAPSLSLPSLSPVASATAAAAAALDLDRLEGGASPEALRRFLGAALDAGPSPAAAAVFLGFAGARARLGLAPVSAIGAVAR